VRLKDYEKPKSGNSGNTGKRSQVKPPSNSKHSRWGCWRGKAHSGSSRGGGSSGGGGVKSSKVSPVTAQVIDDADRGGGRNGGGGWNGESAAGTQPNLTCKEQGVTAETTSSNDKGDVLLFEPSVRNSADESSAANPAMDHDEERTEGTKKKENADEEEASEDDDGCCIMLLDECAC
jgi:hypothetical protein